MAATLGTIEAFDPTQPEEWEAYKERLDCFLCANGIDDPARKRAVFLSVCGKSTYSLIKSLSSPALPATKTFGELLALLTEHLTPRSSEIASTVKFFNRSQHPGESIASYVAELRRLASDCNFGINLTRQIRDRLVSGLRDEACQRRLLAEPNLTLEQALASAKASEAAAQNQMDIRNKVPAITTEVKQLQLHGKPRRTEKKPTNAKTHKPCDGCGGNHRRQDCRFKNADCRHCKKRGHIERVCRAKSVPNSGPSRQTNRTVDSLSNAMNNLPIEDASIYSLKARTPFPLSPQLNKAVAVVQINGKDCPMEVDSGSEFSIISLKTYRQLWPTHGPEIKPEQVCLRDFQGKTVSLEGSCSVKVTFNRHQAILLLLIARGDRTSLFGYSWFQPLGVALVGLHHVETTATLQSIIEDFKEIFEPGLGSCTAPPVALPLDPTVTPVRMKPRRVPYALKPKIDEELDRLIREGVLEPIANPRWSTAIVPVVKSDGSIRLCADYKVTLNPALQGYAYPIPAVADLAGGKIYAKIDLASAYLQLRVDDAAAEAQTIITHRGAFRAKRLQFGIKTAPGIFQEFMEHLLAGIDGVLPYFDDILVKGSSEAELASRVRQVLQRLKDKQLRARKDKCIFGASSVEYLGYVIEETGVRPSPSLLRAIHNAPDPKNKEELQAFLGLLNFYHNFLPDKSTVLEPLHRLLSKNSKWSWGKSQSEAFSTAKKMLSSDSLLTHFDEKKPIVLTCDASPYGLGAVLSHILPDGSEAPIAYHSRSLTPAERNYAQIDREAAAIVTGVKKFHNYLYGHHFKIVTDHKPLLGLMSSSRETPAIISPRMLRWTQLLNAYDYDLEYRPGKSIGNADGLSRLPLPQSDFQIPPLLEVSFLESLPGPPLTATEIARMTQQDPVMAQVLRWTLSGWPSTKVTEEFQPFLRRQHELSVHKSCLLWGNRVVIPDPGHSRVLEELHLSHPGIVRMKALARSHVWWPGIDSDIEDHVKSCTPCQESRHAPPKAPVHPWEVPRAPWSRIHLDFAGPMQGQVFLILVDAYSKWLEVSIMPSMTSTAVIRELRRIFAVHGLPDSIVSDNGTAFTSDEFKAFAEMNQIRLIKVAPYHPSSNGQAERMVQTAKEGLKRISGGNWNQRLASFLLRQHITPNTATGQSPAEMLMGRRLKSCLDRLHPDHTTTRQEQQDVQTATAPPARSFQPQDKVFVRNHRAGPDWVPATVETATGPISYRVTTPAGFTMRCHIDQMRERRESIPAAEPPPAPPVPSPTTEPLPSSTPPPTSVPPSPEVQPSHPVPQAEPPATPLNSRPRRQTVRPRYLQDFWTGEGM